MANLRLIGKLYQREREWDAANVSNDQRRKLRQSHFARPLHWLKKIVLSVREHVLPKSGLGKACDYLVGHWTPLTAHSDHGQTTVRPGVGIVLVTTQRPLFYPFAPSTRSSAGRVRIKRKDKKNGERFVDRQRLRAVRTAEKT